MYKFTKTVFITYKILMLSFESSNVFQNRILLKFNFFIVPHLSDYLSLFKHIKQLGTKFHCTFEVNCIFL